MIQIQPDNTTLSDLGVSSSQKVAWVQSESHCATVGESHSGSRSCRDVLAAASTQAVQGAKTSGRAEKMIQIQPDNTTLSDLGVSSSQKVAWVPSESHCAIVGEGRSDPRSCRDVLVATSTQAVQGAKTSD